MSFKNVIWFQFPNDLTSSCPITNINETFKRYSRSLADWKLVNTASILQYPYKYGDHQQYFTFYRIIYIDHHQLYIHTNTHSKKKSILQLGAWYNMPLPYPHPMPEIPTQFQPILRGQLEGILKTHCGESKQRREYMGVWVLIMMILLGDSSYRYGINSVIDMSDTNDQWFWHWHTCWH